MWFGPEIIKLDIIDPTDIDSLLRIEFSCDGCGKAAEGVMFGRQSAHLRPLAVIIPLATI